MNKNKPIQYRLSFFMKVTIVHLLITSFSMAMAYAIDGSAQTILDQKITLDAEGAEFKNVLMMIGKQVNADFAYSPELFEEKKKVSIHVRRTKLSVVLSNLLSPSVSFKVVGKQIVLMPRYQSAVDAPVRSTYEVPVFKITGKVSDNTGAGLPGVNILLKGTTTGANTDADGRYSIEIPDALNAVLVFSFIGYSSVEVPVANQTSIDVTLEEDIKSLGEVVVVGYGTQKKINMTGSVATIEGKELLQAQTTNVTNSLGGRLAGVVAVNGNGQPGSGSSIQIRGLSTLNDNSALVVVDGVVRSDDFGNLNPNDIESISVLKDAAAAAVYGARAANGVILITTKRGKDGHPTISYNATTGFQQPTQYPDLMSSYQYGVTRNQALINQGFDPSNPVDAGRFYSDQTLETFKPGITDWYKSSFKSKSYQSQQNLSINGGTEAVRYFASLGYVDQDGMYDNFNFKRYNLRANIDAKISKNLSIGLNLEGRQELKDQPGWDANSIFQFVIRESPVIPAYHPDGKPFNTNGEHPIEMIRSSGYGKDKTSVYLGTLTFEEKLDFITKGLSLRGTASYFSQDLFTKSFSIPYKMYDEDANGVVTNTKVVGGNSPQLKEVYDEKHNTTLNASLNYARTFGKHELAGLVLFEQYSSKQNSFTAIKQDFSTTVKDDFYASGPNNQSITGTGRILDARRSLVGRLNYGFNSKYFAEFTFRYDGSFRFPANKRFGFFPAASVGWRISEENFFQNSGLATVVDNLKLRFSKGLIGNDRVDAYQFLDTYTITANRGPIIGGQAVSNVSYGTYPNPNITWETQSNNNIGLDASLLDSKLAFEFDYFFRTTQDILWKRQRSVPETFGRALSNENYAEVKSRGLEATLTHQNTVGSVSYNIRLLGSYSTNEVTVIDDPANALDFQKQLGRPIGVTRPTLDVTNTDRLGIRTGYDALGIFQTQAEADEWFGGTQFGQKSLAGDVKYADVDGDGELTSKDQIVLSDYTNTPRIMLGFSGSVKWHHFDFSFLLQGAGQRNVMLTDAGRIMYQNGGSSNNFAYLADSWSPTNTGAQYPQAWVGSRSINDRDSQIWLRKAGYMRLKTMELGYSINPDWLASHHIRQVRFYVSGYNLLTWSQIKEFDPEAESVNGNYYPQQRNLNLGVNITL